MEKQNRVNEADTPTIMVPKPELKQTLATLKGQKVNIVPIDKKIMEEPEAVIQPQDRATIQYLSNVKDAETGEISQPFSIGDKRYQMVRALTPDNNVIMGVYCFDDMDDNGNNVIHDVQYFEENIAKPMKEKMETPNEVKKQDSTLGLGEYRHYIVNEKTGKFRKFKTIEELAKANMNEGEKYMGLREFKKYFEGRVFGGNRHFQMSENQTPQDAEQFKRDVQNATAVIEKLPIVQNKLKKVNNPIEKSQFMLAIAEIIGLDLKLFAQTVKKLRQTAKINTQNKTSQPTQPVQQPVTESKTKRIIKVKDINNE